MGEKNLLKNEKAVKQAGAAKQTGLMTRDMALCGLFAALIGTGAFIRITLPLQPYPMHFTLQWFFVLLAGFLLGSKLAFASVATYLIVGLVGVPVFAAGGGPAYLIRPTFGFLLGFAFAAWIIGFLCEIMRPSGMLKMMIPATAGLVVYYAAGVLYFYFISNYVISMPVAWIPAVVNCCVTAFPDFLLCVLAAIAAARMRPVVAQMME